MQLEQMYQELILDHYRSPHGAGLREPFDAESTQINPTCGDEITLRVKLDGDTVTDVSHETLGCSISQASASMMSDVVEGKSVAEIRELSDAFTGMMRNGDGGVPEALGDIEALQGVAKFPVRVKCATLAWHTLEEGIDRHEKGEHSVRIEEI